MHRLKYLGIFLFICSSILSERSIAFQIEPVSVEYDFEADAKLIRDNYEQNAYKLSRFKVGHMGLRFFRHYGDEKYIPLFFEGIELAEQSLNKIYERGLDSLSISIYIEKSNRSYYSTSTTRKRLRSKTLSDFPEYRFYATKLLRHVARLDEVGLRHQYHDEFIEVLKGYDFEEVFTDEKMIRAWGAQLANQVYWLKQLGIADYTKAFREAVLQVYPEEEDGMLSKQQFENKLYTLKHIVIAASGYYQVEVAYEDFDEIIDYFRRNTVSILERAKEDVVIEVGISLLLTGEDYPEIDIIRRHISDRINREKQMIPSPSGRTDFEAGEHRNIIGVLLLDWQGAFQRPGADDLEKWRSKVPNTLYTYQ